MDHDPQTHRESQSEPNQIAEGLVCGPNGVALGAAEVYSHDHERAEKQRAKNDGKYSQPHRDRRRRWVDARRTWLLWLDAHSLNYP